MTDFSVQGTAALVTGATSGLGAHMARLLAAKGAKVVLAARRMDRLIIQADAIGGSGGTALPVAMDVTDEASVEEAFAAAEDAFGTITLLVNNAGIPGPSRRALEVDAASFAEVIAVDLTGAYRVARRAAGAMVAAATGGSIVNIASIAGLRPLQGVVAYDAAKAGLIHMTRALALEWARHGIRVNALAPGYIRTEINQDFLATDQAQAIVTRIPQRRLGEPEDLDGALLLLASSASRYITGTVLPIDGGHLVSAL